MGHPGSVQIKKFIGVEENPAEGGEAVFLDESEAQGEILRGGLPREGELKGLRDPLLLVVLFRLCRGVFHPGRKGAQKGVGLWPWLPLLQR